MVHRVSLTERAAGELRVRPAPRTASSSHKTPEISASWLAPKISILALVIVTQNARGFRKLVGAEGTHSWPEHLAGGWPRAILDLAPCGAGGARRPGRTRFGDDQSRGRDQRTGSVSTVRVARHPAL